MLTPMIYPFTQASNYHQILNVQTLGKYDRKGCLHTHLKLYGAAMAQYGHCLFKHSQ